MHKVDADERQPNRTDYVGHHVGRKPSVVSGQQLLHSFSGEGRECGQAAQNTGRREKPELHGQGLEALKDADEAPHHEGSDPICRQRSWGQMGEQVVKNDGQNITRPTSQDAS